MRRKECAFVVRDRQGYFYHSVSTNEIFASKSSLALVKFLTKDYLFAK